MTGEPTHEPPAPTYTMGYSDEFQKMLGRRNAAANAAHLLPHLHAGLRVLDFGCGPGTVSMGLAEAVAPGELHGIDMEASQVETARAAAMAGGHDNAFFRIGDVTALEAILKLVQANGGHPQMGKELKRVLLDAGFSDIRAGTSFGPYTTTEDIHFFHGFVSGWFFSPETVEVVVRHGLASHEQVDRWRHMLDEWRDSPGAMAAIAWGEAIARKP